MNEQILKFLIKQKEQCRTPEIIKAIEQQERLSNELMEKRNLYYRFRDQSYMLLKEGTRKLLEKYPELEAEMPKEDISMNIIHKVLDVALNDTQKYHKISEKRNTIEELNEDKKLQPLYAEVFYEYIVAFSNYELNLKKDRERLFSAEYKDKIASYADEGVFLYHLETPDLPILDKEIQMNDILEAFLYNDCEGMREVFSTLLNMENPGIFMKRKQEDISITIDLINCGYYRSAVRNLFALLDSEHKKAANTYEGIIEKRKEYKKGLNRSKKIAELIDNLDNSWVEVAWNKIDDYYKKVMATNPVDNVIHRNSIVHGDYHRDLIDVDKYSATKLLLLYLNMSIIADTLCYKEEILKDILMYLPAMILYFKKEEC